MINRSLSIFRDRTTKLKIEATHRITTGKLLFDLLDYLHSWHQKDPLE